uniref:Serpentine Receptor, class H n=1 Tax=Caenorhabditis tropicalis TaxID=1561998 RepID=A0A1I7T6M6_9PELO
MEQRITQLIFKRSITDRNESSRISGRFPVTAQFFLLPDSFSLNLFLLFLLLGGFLTLIMFFVFMTGIFYIMKSLKTKMAKSTYKKHSDAVRSLQVQLITAIICIVPPGFVVFVVILEFGNAQILTEIAMAWYGTHAVLNMTSMMIFFPPFRKWMRKRYGNMTGKTIMLVLLVILVESLQQCFVVKHQILARIENKHVIPNWMRVFLRTVIVIVPFVTAVWFPSLGVSEDEKWRLIEENHREYLEDFKSLPSFALLPKSLNLSSFFLFLLIGSIIIIIIFFVFMIGIFNIMKLLKTKMAKSTYKKHSDAVRSLCIALLFFVLAGYMLLVILLEFENGQLLTEIGIALYGTHAMLNMTTLLIFFPPFRRWIRKRYEKITGKVQDKSKLSMVIVSQM